MTTKPVSDRKRASNRKNAGKSTGPKSSLGKRRSAQNALNHGLAIPVASVAEFQDDLEAIALSIAHAVGHLSISDLSREAAEAQLDIFRCRKLRASILSRKISPDALNESLIRLERYERRAFSRRYRALRALDP
jgi:hypothetical protein